MFVGSILSFSRGGREKEGLPNGFHSLPLPGKEEQQTGKPNSQSGRQDKQQEIQVILDLVPILFTISSNTPQLQTFLSPAPRPKPFPPREEPVHQQLQVRLSQLYCSAEDCSLLWRSGSRPVRAIGGLPPIRSQGPGWLLQGSHGQRPATSLNRTHKHPFSSEPYSKGFSFILTDASSIIWSLLLLLSPQVLSRYRKDDSISIISLSLLSDRSMATVEAVSTVGISPRHAATA